MAKRAPCVMIGWDGATWDLLRPWVEQGKLPNLAAMMARGSSRVLRSIIPPVTPAAWVSILSGMNVGKHGVLDFKEINPHDYVSEQSTLTNSTHFAGITIFDLLSERDMKVAALQLPLTYPVWPVKGVMLAGIPNPDDSQPYAFPGDRKFPPLRPEKIRSSMAYPELLKNCAFHIEKLTDIYCDLAKEDFDLYCVYYRESDDFHHRYWRFLGEHCRGYNAAEAAQLGNPIFDVYKLMDDALGRVMAARPDANFYLISDHGGHEAPYRRFYVNTWLAKQGYMTRSRNVGGLLQRMVYGTYKVLKPLIPMQVRKTVSNEHSEVARKFAAVRNNSNAIDWSQSRAFGVVLSHTLGIQINLRGREAQGCVSPGAEYESLRDEIIASLKTVKDPETGDPIVVEVHRREEVVNGPHVEKLPDIMALLDLRLVTRTDLNSDVFGEVPTPDFLSLSGEHDMNGIFVAAGPNLRQADMLPEASLMDVAPTMLAGLHQAIPENMDGRVLEDVFTPSFLIEHPPQRGDARELVVQTGENVFSAEEEEAVRARLQDLGYLGE